MKYQQAWQSFGKCWDNIEFILKLKFNHFQIDIRCQVLDSLHLQAEAKKAPGKDGDKGELEEKSEEQKEDQYEPIRLSVRDV